MAGNTREQISEHFRFDSLEDRNHFFSQIKLLIKNLKTPDSLTDDVRKFCKTLSDQRPFYLSCEPEPWSRQSCCDTNVEEYIKIHGGTAMYGHRIWFNNPVYIEAESHAIWKDGNAVRDVSFVDSGDKRTLFVPAHSSFRGVFDELPEKIRHAFATRDLKLVRALNKMEASIPYTQMSREEVWATMLTYEQWMAGSRMPNMIAVERERSP